MKNKEIKCSHCREENVVKRGFFKTKVHGKQQRYYCKSCDRKFIEQNPFYRMKNNSQKITLCLDLFYRGLSTRQIQSHLQAFYPQNSSNVSIYKWVKKYVSIISKFTDKLKVNIGSYIEVDEMEYHRRKSHKAKLGVDKNWSINAIEVKHRFLLCSSYAKRRNQKELKAVFRKVKEKTGNQVRTITTDGLMQYEKVIKKVYGYDKHKRKHNVVHNKVTASKGEGFNIWVERLHNSIRQRTRGFRGLHGSIESAYVLMKGLEIFYNFIRKHEALKGKTPSELAIPSLEFKTPNKWLELIKLANNN